MTAGSASALRDDGLPFAGLRHAAACLSTGIPSPGFGLGSRPMDALPFHAATSGFLLGASFIFSIGPQNLALINAGLARDNTLLVASTGYLSEVVLVVLGLIGFQSSVNAYPSAVLALHLLGILFLIVYGTLAIRRGFRQSPAARSEVLDDQHTRQHAVLAMLAVTWFNPLVYVEIVLIVGLISSAFDSRVRFWFGLGFLLASAFRFYGLSLTGQLLRSWLAQPVRRQHFAMISGCLLLCSAAMLAGRAVQHLVQA
jgi:L-lysine exporter family protein LysE/ArgO